MSCTLGKYTHGELKVEHLYDEVEQFYNDKSILVPNMYDEILARDRPRFSML
jgi:hypothetical protein